MGAGVESGTPDAEGPAMLSPRRWSLPTPVLHPAPLRLPPRPIATGKDFFPEPQDFILLWCFRSTI